jgi:Fur family transcriptional regulator, zinc uptake regulator
MVHTHSHTSVDQSETAQAVFEAAGEQWTHIRAAVYDAIAKADAPLSAYDIADRMSTQLTRRIAPNTVYRILDLFLAHNIVSRIESKNAYVACAHPDAREDCIFLVCERCGGTSHQDDTEIGAKVRAIASQAGFQSRRPVIEVHGLCAACLPKRIC